MADELSRVRAVLIPDLEPAVNITDENEPHTEVIYPFGVQIIIDDLGFATVLPSGMRDVGLFRFQRTNRIGD